MWASCAAPFAKLAVQMALPQTATLAVPGPLPVAGTDGGRAWFQAFDESGEVIAVRQPRCVIGAATEASAHCSPLQVDRLSCVR